MNSWIIHREILGMTSGACAVHEAPALSAPAETRLVTLKPIPAALTEEGSRVIEAVTSPIGSIGELREAQFVDATNGWVSGRQTPYHTANAGTSWNLSNLDLPEDSYITSFFFVDANHGWITVIHKDDTKKYTRG